jgi:biopolymer transport protein ExbD/biopolymer transport protein TolR
MPYKKVLTDVNSEPNVVPMADIMLVLLIIFMVVTPMLQKGVSVDLVRTENPRNMPDADREDAVVVAITRDGNTFLGADLVTDNLVGQVQERVAAKADKTVYIKSDARTRYERVVAVVDEVRSAGVDQVGLITERVEEQGQQAAAAAATGL